MIITISGTPGSGKGTVGKMLAKKLGYKYFSIGGMRRAMAMERGLSLQEFNVLGERQAFTDRDVDQWQKKLGEKSDNLIVEGRTSFHFIPHSIKVFLTADLLVAAKRIFHDPAHVRLFEASHKYHSPVELAHGLRGRMASDTRRYRKYYKLNIFLRRHYDLNIDTTNQTPKQTMNEILKYLAKISKNSAKGDNLGTKHPQVGKNLTRKGKVLKHKKTAKISSKKVVKRK